jgi:hypothetical protein
MDNFYFQTLFAAFLTFLVYLSINRLNAYFVKVDGTEDDLEKLTLESIKVAVRQELQEELRTQLEPIKIDLLAVKGNQGNLVIELRTLGVVKETTVLK